MRVLHLLTSGNIGGIEVLCRDIGLNSTYQHTFVFLFGKGLVYDDMKSKKLNVVSLEANPKISKQRFDELRELAVNHDAVIVHHNDPFLEMYYLALMQKIPNKIYISMIHHCYDPQEDTQNYGIVKRIIKDALISRMFRKSNKLIFVSKAGMESYKVKYPVDMNKSVVVYNGIGTDKLSDSVDINKKNCRPIKLLYVGRLEKIKGVSQLIEAIKLLEEKDFILSVVGDGSERKNLEEQVKRMCLQEKVRFEGFQRDVKPWMKEASIFIYPSKMEIFGISLVEAMACRCICVANAVGGIPEIIQDTKNGFLNRENTAVGLSVCIQKAMDILQDPMRSCEMQQNARATAEQFGILDTIRALEAEVSNSVHQ